MVASFVAYIDESGDDGLRFRSGSTEWLVLSAVITARASDLETVKLVDTFRNDFGMHSKKPIHFRKLGSLERSNLISRIAKANLSVVSIIIHKPSLQRPEQFRERNRLYFYGVRLLLERVSWYCRDHHSLAMDGDGSVVLTFSQRKDLSYREIGRYLGKVGTTSANGQPSIDLAIVRPEQIEVYSHGRRLGLQIADAVASGTFCAVRSLEDGLWCRDYIEGLKPVVYHRRGKYLGYGLKFFPNDVTSLLTAEHRFRWVQAAYGLQTMNDADTATQDPTFARLPSI